MSDEVKGGNVTRSDVARLAGVSTAVVSYVLNDGPRPVAGATRQRVLDAIEHLQYRPNAAARALKNGTMKTIGLIVPDISNPYFADFAREVSTAAFGVNHAMLLGDANNDPEREHAQVRSLVDRQVDGILLISLRPREELRMLGSEPIPIVLLDQLEDDAGTKTVVIDNYGGAVKAVSHLMSHGHREVAFIGGPVGMPGADARLSGWLDCQYHLSDERRQSLIFRAPFSRQGGYEAGLALLASGDVPRAAFVSSDVQAIGLLLACRERGVSVPHDLAIVSFDGTEEAAYSAPPLSAVRQPMSEIAAAAVRTLLDTQDRFAPHQTIESELILRESCGTH